MRFDQKNICVPRSRSFCFSAKTMRFRSNSNSIKSISSVCGFFYNYILTWTSSLLIVIINIVSFESKGVSKTMLQDFYMLEMYFGASHSAVPVDELIKKYGSGEVTKNINQGYLQVRKAGCCGSRSGFSLLCWLSDAGRSIARNMADIVEI